MRRWIDAVSTLAATLTEAYTAGGYTAHRWQRWWGNNFTGQLIPVHLGDDHDAYFLAHLDEFFTPNELARLPEPGSEPYDDVEPDAEIQNASDEILIAAYDK